MDLSVTDNADLNRERNRAEQEKRKLVEELERTKTEYEQALASKNQEVNLEIERIKNIWKNKCAKKEWKLLKRVNISYKL